MIDDENWDKSVKKIRNISKRCYNFYFGGRK